jgi:hypothetical protein
MDRAENRTRARLKVDRGCERSRLERQLLAAAYDLVTPLLRRPLAPSTASRPAGPHTSVGDSARPRAGGSHA